MLKDASVLQTKFICFSPIWTQLHLFELFPDGSRKSRSVILAEVESVSTFRLVPYGKSGTMVSMILSGKGEYYGKFGSGADE